MVACDFTSALGLLPGRAMAESAGAEAEAEEAAEAEAGFSAAAAETGSVTPLRG